MNGKRRSYTVTGAIVLFVTVCALFTVAIGVYVGIDSATDNKAVIAAVMLAAILALSCVCTVVDLLRRKYTVDKKVRDILDATDRIAAGDFSVRLAISHPIERYDTYDFIMENLNKMVSELSCTEVLHADFISNVSHELKTPLAVIQNYATLLQDKRLDEPTRNKYAETLVGASKRLTALITNILKLNKLENQKITAKPEDIDLSEMLAQIVLGFEDSIENKKLDLDCDIEEGVTIKLLPGYSEIVWNNLLSNAIKFTESGGHVAVSLKRSNGRAIVTVSDSGCGISAETGKHIFEKFYQGDTSHSQEGNGLGLALVKKVIDIIGGTISVESEPGKGTTFTVTLQED